MLKQLGVKESDLHKQRNTMKTCDYASRFTKDDGGGVVTCRDLSEAGISRIELARKQGIDEKEVCRMMNAGQGTKLSRIAEAVEASVRNLHIAFA